MPHRPKKPRAQLPVQANPKPSVWATTTSPIQRICSSFRELAPESVLEFIRQMLGKSVKPRHIRKMLGDMSGRQFKKHRRKITNGTK